MTADAVLSPCAKYRYTLTRSWGPGPAVVFVMLNPSTADAETDDPTIRRCVTFAKREGAGRLHVVNLFAYRATNPAELKRVDDPVGPANDAVIGNLIDSAAMRDWPVIAAWGATDVWPARNRAVARLIRAYGVQLRCLGTTARGHPKHPLYIPTIAPLVPFEGAR